MTRQPEMQRSWSDGDSVLPRFSLTSFVYSTFISSSASFLKARDIHQKRDLASHKFHLLRSLLKITSFRGGIREMWVGPMMSRSKTYFNLPPLIIAQSLSHSTQARYLLYFLLLSSLSHSQCRWKAHSITLNDTKHISRRYKLLFSLFALFTPTEALRANNTHTRFISL